MDSLLANLSLGLQVALVPMNLLLATIGVIVGTLIGVLPGIGPLATMAMLLPITYYASPEGAIIMLAGIYYGAQYGGSTTAILVNMPGESSSAVTTLDGYQMARQGRAGAALTVAALGSFFGGTVAILALALFAVPLSSLALAFGPADYFSLMLFGLLASTLLARGSFVKAVGMILVGILVGLVGTDINSGVSRFTLGLPELLDGIELAALFVGLFGIAEILRNLTEQAQNGPTKIEKIGSLFITRKELRAPIPAMVRGSLVGSILGILPGGGALLSSFASYALEKKVSRHPEEFGRGAIQGVAGPETANNAGAQTSFIPMLTLGIPSNVVMAILIGALLIQGIAPGPLVMTQRPELVWGLIVSMWIGNILLVIINLPLVGVWVSLLRIPYRILFPCIILLCAIGVFSVNNLSFDLYVAAGFGLFGYLLMKLDCEPAPMSLGIILGPAMEENFRRAMLLSRGNANTFLVNPISLGFLIASAAVVLLIALPMIRQQREIAFVEEE
jgi:TctA family transporter